MATGKFIMVSALMHSNSRKWSLVEGDSQKRNYCISAHGIKSIILPRL